MCGCQVLHLLETVLSSVVALMAIEASRKDAMHNLTAARDEVMHRRAAAAAPAAVSAIARVQARSKGHHWHLTSGSCLTRACWPSPLQPQSNELVTANAFLLRLNRHMCPPWPACHLLSSWPLSMSARTQMLAVSTAASEQ